MQVLAFLSDAATHHCFWKPECFLCPGNSNDTIRLGDGIPPDLWFGGKDNDLTIITTTVSGSTVYGDLGSAPSTSPRTLIHQSFRWSDSDTTADGNDSLSIGKPSRPPRFKPTAATTPSTLAARSSSTVARAGADYVLSTAGLIASEVLGDKGATANRAGNSATADVFSKGLVSSGVGNDSLDITGHMLTKMFGRRRQRHHQQRSMVALESINADSNFYGNAGDDHFGSVIGGIIYGGTGTDTFVLAALTSANLYGEAGDDSLPRPLAANATITGGDGMTP